MKVQCPHCKTYQQVPDPYLGQQVKCVKCKAPFASNPSESPNKEPIPRPSPPVQPSPPGSFLRTIGIIGICVSILGLVLIPINRRYARIAALQQEIYQSSLRSPSPLEEAIADNTKAIQSLQYTLCSAISLTCLGLSMITFGIGSLISVTATCEKFIKKSK